MFEDKLQVYTLSIALLGEFNPVIIQPYWLAYKKLIRENEGANAKVELIHEELVRFKIGEWALIEATRNRFEFRTSDERHFEPLVDLAISIFSILKETPIKAMGVNHVKHYDLSNAGAYYDFGNRLVPLNNWDVFNNPKLLEVEILEQPRSDKFDGYYRAKFSPSDLIQPFGILFSLNDHYTFKESKTNNRTDQMISTLKDCWETSKAKATEITEKVWANMVK